jgi:hypothetical protein
VRGLASELPEVAERTPGDPGEMVRGGKMFARLCEDGDTGAARA